MKIFRLFVFLGNSEYGNDKMLKAAQEQAALHVPGGQSPLLITVHEHGGWWLQYYFDASYPSGIVVGTANDAARFSGEVTAIRDRLQSEETTIEYLGEVRR